MPKIKTLLPVFVVLLFLGVANTAFAQLSCNVASTPVSRDTDTGLTEPAGDLIFNCIGGASATAAATLTIDYGTPITDNTAFPTLNAACNLAMPGTTCAGGPVRIPGPPSMIGFPGGAPSVNAISNASGQIIIAIPAQPAPAPNNSFTLSGVLLGLSGSGKLTVTANVSSSPGSNVLITAGQNVATVVTTVLAGIKTPTVSAGPSVVLTNGNIITAGFSIRTEENYIDMYRNLSQFNQGATTNGVQLLYTFSGIPTGITLGGPCAATLTNASTGAVTGAAVVSSANNTLTSTTNTISVQVDNTLPGADLTALERITLTCGTFTIGGTATVPLTAGSITATVTLAPTGTAFSSTGAVLTGATTPAGLVPRYTANPLPTPPLTVVNIIPATTNMLFPFVAVGNGFDTGFAIANTTADPYGFAAGGARPQGGTVALFFYPSSGTAFCVTTGGTASLTPGGTACTALSTTAVGQGLSSGGVVASGASWVVLGSEVFRQITGAPTVFTGYAFGIANFTNGHSTAFVADAAFSGKFTSGGPALIVPVPAVLTRSAVVSGEGLSH